jgi:hypothetical protein
MALSDMDATNFELEQAAVESSLQTWLQSEPRRWLVQEVDGDSNSHRHCNLHCHRHHHHRRHGRPYLPQTIQHAVQKQALLIIQLAPRNLGPLRPVHLLLRSLLPWLPQRQQQPPPHPWIYPIRLLRPPPYLTGAP